MFHVTRGSGAPLLLVHGFCVDHRLLLTLDGAAGAHGGWRRIYVDLPGMGRSDAGPEIDGSDAVAAALVRFVQEELGDEPFAVLGSSYGGMIARDLVAQLRDQVLGLALLAPLVEAEPAARDVPPRTVLVEDPTLLSSLDPDDAREYADMAVVQSAEGWALFRDHALPGLRAFRPEVIDRLQARYALTKEPEAGSPPFLRPTLLVTGRQDHVVGHRSAAALVERHYPHATTAVLDRAGHNVHLDQPVLTAALLDDWLSRMDVDR
ncbi:alpha/beta fold hydrolase [Cellulomonas sp. URHE0023]|uniref:alpha/beta fold hydrolase n=1 Tax=Cellulomonas sp. URHE0023 TaxID=1380354 RepID=UPI000485010C|nr:alpha/beta fold hydrolase [Cellulomonas sp. URHE0023]